MDEDELRKREEVAKAIYEGRNGRGAVPFRHQPRAHQEPYLADAKTAIEALREFNAAAERDGKANRERLLDELDHLGVLSGLDEQQPN